MERVAAINALEPAMQALTYEELRNKTEEFRMRLECGRDTLDTLLPEAFALVRETSRRLLNLRHYDVQLIGGMALHEGQIAQINTGEGKTLVATLPAYLNALEGKGVHVLTVNTYLAARDAQWVGGIFGCLGMTVGVVTDHVPGPANQAAFDADVTYATAPDLGWLYLTDNSEVDREERLIIRRPFHYAIVDEADSVLIDDAVRPLIICKAFAARDDSKAWRSADEVCRLADWDAREEAPPGLLRQRSDGQQSIPVRLWDKRGPWEVDGSGDLIGDVLINPVSKSLVITERGWDHIAHAVGRLGHSPSSAVHHGQASGPDDLWAGDLPLAQYVQLRLQACLYLRGVDYLVRGGRVVLLNQSTGRTQDFSRWAHGVHQAVEVKEGVQPQTMETTMASITYQMLFQLYPNLGGMTGTAASAEDEFLEMYRRPVEVIPPHEPSQRVDHPVEVFMEREVSQLGGYTAKQRRLLRLVGTSLQKRQPVLIGTTSVQESEEWVLLFEQLGIPHQLLNATPSAVRREAEIIAQAGMPMTSPGGGPAVTIATSMAGRGTDIRLGGDPKGLMQMGLRSLLLPLMVDPRHDAEGWVACQQEACPLVFWPRGPIEHALIRLRRHLPDALCAELESASTAVMATYSGPQSKVPLATAKSWLTTSFKAAETTVPAFLFQMRREVGDGQRGKADSLLFDLDAFCAKKIPVRSLNDGDEEAGVRSRVDRAAVWLWVWLEIFCCPLQAADARAAGGLRVICTSLAPSWRVWDQFKGRAGRQGDPGDTYVLLSWQQDLQMDPLFGNRIPELLAERTDGAEPTPLPASLALRLILKPAMTVREGAARDARSMVKQADEVLHTIRQQLHGFRRWILRSQGRQLHGLMRVYCYDVAAGLMLQHVDVGRHPRQADSWNILQLLLDVWHLVDGSTGPNASASDDQLQISLPVQSLFGVTMPGVGEIDAEILRPAAEMLRQSLIDPASPKPAAIAETADVDLETFQEEMLRARAAFATGGNDRYRGLQSGRFSEQAMQLVDYLACVIYLAWLGPKRRQMRLVMQLSLPRGVRLFDSAQQGDSNAFENNGGGSADLEEAVQTWERRCFARALTELWVGLLADSSSAWDAAGVASISRLSPIQEYTSAMSARFVRLLDDHRMRSLQRIFVGPSHSELFADPLVAAWAPLEQSPTQDPSDDRNGGEEPAAESSAAQAATEIV